MTNAIIRFFKTPTGKFVGFLVCGAVFLAFRMGSTAAQQAKKAQQTLPPMSALTTVDSGLPTASAYTVNKDVAPAKTTVIMPSPTPRADANTPVASRHEDGQAEPAKKRVPIKVYAQPPATSGSDEVTINPEEPYAPYGRLVQCELVITVDSSSIDTPIVGLVTKDLSWNKKLIIPANSEVHGAATSGQKRDRIASNGTWTVVLAEGTGYPAGTELVIQGLALDMDCCVEKGVFGISDGSAGLKGDVLTSTSTADEVKLFASTFLGGVSKGFVQTQTNAFGMQQVVGGVQSAAAEGVGSVMDQYAKMIMDTIQRDGSYVRVRSGKQFYVYVKQDILLRKARLGASMAIPTQRTVSMQDAAAAMAAAVLPYAPSSQNTQNSGPVPQSIQGTFPQMRQPSFRTLQQ